MTSVVHDNEGKTPLVFRLARLVDESAVSGTGIVAWGTEFPDGSCAVRWNTTTASTAIWDSIDDVREIHGHHGLTRIEWYLGAGQGWRRED